MAIELDEQVRDRLVASIKRYCSENLDEEMGDLKARLFLDYVLVEIGPSIYNRAISDAEAYFRERVADLEGSCHERELGYWTRGRPTK